MITMELYETILVVLLAVVMVFFIYKWLKTNMFYFEKMDFTQVDRRLVKIPVVDIEMQGYITYPKFMLDKDGTLTEKLPLIIYNGGWNTNGEFVFSNEFIAAIAVGGPYVVLTYDVRGFGKTPGKKALTPQMFEDIKKVIDFAEKTEGIDPNRIGMLGGSFGAMTALTLGYDDDRIKAIVGQCALHNMKETFTRKPESMKARLSLKMLGTMGVKGSLITEELNKIASPQFHIDPNQRDRNSRVFLIHARDDSTIPFSEFEKNKAALNLPNDQVLVYKRGGHTEMKQELYTIGTALRFFRSKLGGG